MAATTQALKVILNASYGVMGADIFPLYFLPAAESTTAIGRHTIQGTIDACEDEGINVLYGDSVPGDTPITCERDGIRQIVPIRSLVAPEGRTCCRQKHNGLRVLSDCGFTGVKYSYSHKVKKRGYRIGTRKAYVEVTDDHSLVIDGREVKPHQLKVGDPIDASDLQPFGSDQIISDDVAWLFGFYLSDGTLADDCVKKSWKMVKGDTPKLEKAQRAISKHLGFRTAIWNHPSDGKPYTLAPTDESASSAITEYFKCHCYSNGTKIVPVCVLNGTLRAKAAFMLGWTDGIDHVDSDKSIVFGLVHKSILAGYVAIMRALNYDYSLKFKKDEPDYIGIRIITDPDGVVGVGPADNTITLLEPFEIDDYVYDLSTHNEHFRGGIGNVLLHNTDSLFVKRPPAGQIQAVIDKAKKDHGVDLEIDKEYRYCVLSNRKKNYFGVTKAGKVDVKGLTGKKSHTPPFIKQAFREILHVLSKIHTEHDFEQAKKEISAKIAYHGSRVEAREIPLHDLAFTMRLSKPPSEYKKTVPQHIKAARQRDDADTIKSGDRISYVKVMGKMGVRPIEKARKDEIDVKKYMEFMESTLEQITSSMGLDFDTMLQKPKQAGLDEFFWG